MTRDEKRRIAVGFHTIYDEPSDFPNHIVLRVHWIFPNGSTVIDSIGCLYDTVGEAMIECREAGLYWLGRYPDDEPQIVGVFI